jgi:RND family efflux transporter MFP subunit
MAWKTDFQVLQLIPCAYRHTIIASGELFVPPSEINTVTAKTDGILVYRKADLVPGTKIEKGTVLFAITGQGLTSLNMEANISGMKSRFEASKAAYHREKVLVKDQIVSGKQFNETITKYQVDSIRYFAYLNGLSGNNMNIIAQANGYVQQLHQSNGTYVAEGLPLITIANSGKIMLRADLPQRNWPEASQIRSASFRLSGSNKVYDLDEIGGKLVATGSAVSADNQFIPVTFEFPNNGSFVPGSFTEVFLRTASHQNQLVIPVSSLMEEQGNYYVYVQTAGESYMKRPVKQGVMDGDNTCIISGLVPGDRVVTRGAIFIKASSQMTGTPSHGHEH